MVDLGQNLSRAIDITIPISTVVSKPLERLRYSTRIDNNSIATNYFESQEINSTNNIVLQDNSFNYAFNDRRKLNKQKFKKVNTLNYSSIYRDVLFTVFTGRNKHGEVTPLFYKQKKSSDSKIVRVNIEKRTNKNTTDEINYGYAIIGGNLYYNYENTYNSLTGEYEIYYLNISYQDGKSENCLINPVPAIEKTNHINRKTELTYTQYKISRGYEYNVIVPEGQTVAQVLCSLDTSFELYIKELDTNSIYLKKPEGQNVENEWIPEIVAGEVYRIDEDAVYRYHIPEYRSQPFSVEAPNLKVFEKDCHIVTEKIIKLPLSNISYLPSEGLNIEIKKYNLNNVQEPSFVGNVQSVDEHNGFVELSGQLVFREGEDYYIRADFYYKTKTLYFNKINLNPYYNREAIDKTYYFYVKPNEDVESVVYKTTKEGDPTWLYLGSLSYEETCNKQNALSFYLDQRDRLYSLEDAINKNPYALQTKLGYGQQGQALQKNNVVIIDLPAEYETNEFYTENELRNLFKRKLKMSTNVILNFVQDESRIKFLKFDPEDVQFEMTWEGPGEYIYERSENKNFTEPHTVREDRDTKPGNNMSSVTDTTAQAGKRYYYRTYYNGVCGKRIYSIKVKGE